MEFFIRKDSTDPILKMQLVLDGRNDFNNFHNKLENSTIYFSMKSVDTGILKVANKKAHIVSKVPTTPNAPTEYYIYYKWSKNNVNKVGRYEGQFIIYFHSDNTELIVPIREDLFITISDSFVKSPC
jgi:hypothetical protein|tara:strand:- start:28792 stop:29172 length:381 start_codon:yes stop_codon:yes gene_type:complete